MQTLTKCVRQCYSDTVFCQFNLSSNKWVAVPHRLKCCISCQTIPSSGHIARAQVIVVTTGSQGEPRAQLSMAARGMSQQLKIMSNVSCSLTHLATRMNWGLCALFLAYDPALQHVKRLLSCCYCCRTWSYTAPKSSQVMTRRLPRC